MKKFALIALIASAGMIQVAHAAYGWSTVLSISCPEGTYLTPVGHCQPEWEFD
ncbi:hypothetical protein P5705_18550 [Pseudomonas entomophila]|uniref:hypothetical protein n=1 Tax=Pseudomonas entomophila TaxID=312306 RepID=UPI002405B919|nr:hypothetical protein [Pseudomonas entomophila]MDF9619651.1 hypothetical protein [Pseudomonas entomophila]